ncbi:MAG: putative metalloprotease CJM1_0395 family protein [Pseudomonadota bacterium]
MTIGPLGVPSPPLFGGARLSNPGAAPEAVAPEAVAAVGDRVELSSKAVPPAPKDETSEKKGDQDRSRDRDRDNLVDASGTDPDSALFQKLSEEEKTEVAKLRKRDQEVQAHEKAHLAAGGQYTSGRASYEYQTGPDGKKYAVGGEVSIDVSAESDPRATIKKAQTVRKAALAPAKPSAQDRKIAAEAAKMEAQARQDLAEQNSEQAQLAVEQKKATGNYAAAASRPNPYQALTEDRSRPPPTPPVSGRLDFYV